MRDNINVNSSLKLFESYRDFSGGLNTQQSNEMMRDNQSIIAENVDLSITSSIKKRTGRTKLPGAFSGYSGITPIQGVFKFVNNAETVLISAVAGRLFYARPVGTTYSDWNEIPIFDGLASFTFQDLDAVEAVQYGEWLYVATGTKLVRTRVYMSGTSVVASAETVVDQYKPTPQEALEVGLNALNTTPSAYLTDSTTGGAGTLNILGIGYNGTSLVLDQAKTFTAYIRTANPAPSVDYQWSYRESGTTSWTNMPNYHPWSSSYKSASFIPLKPGTYDIRVEARLSSASSTNDEFTLFNVEVYATPQPTPLETSNIQKCRKILLHWDRLILYDPKPSSTSGSTNQQDQMFISQVGEPRYFPATNVISFAADTYQRIRKVVRYRNILLIFTPDTIQSLAGKSPADYVRSLVNNQLGAIWANSVQVVENDVYFVSKQGIYAVRPNVYTQDNFNVASLDTFIMDQFAAEFVVPDSVSGLELCYEQVTSIVFDNQYILYGLHNKIYRHYYDRKAWVIDDLSHLTPANVITRFATPIVAAFNGEQTIIEPVMKYNPSTVAMIFTEFGAWDKSVYTDFDVAYTMTLRTKYFDLSYAFNYKKLRKIYVIARLQGSDVNLGVTVQADAFIVLDAEEGTVEVDPITGAVSWQINSVPNFIFYSGTAPQASLTSPIGNWISGITSLGEIPLAVLHANIRAKCRRVRVTFQHSDGSPCEVYGFGLEFRAKKP